MDDPQSVADDQALTDTPAKPGTEVAPDAADAQEPSLDALLKDVRTEDFEPEPKKPEPADDGEMKALAKTVEQLVRKDAMMNVDKDIGATAEKMQGFSDVTKGLPLSVFRGALHERANGNPQMAVAFMNREQNPAQWETITTALAKEIHADFENQPDAKLTADREAVEASVRGVSTVPQSDQPTPKEISEMTDDQITAVNKAGDRALGL